MKPKNNIGKCKLCGSVGKLCESHIISEFIYKPIYEENIHRFSSVSPISKKGDKLYEQKGIKEHLLCQKCEAQFSRCELYVNGEIDRIRNSIEINSAYTVVENIDYKMFKLFELSILWRASASTVFKSVNLESHEETIRQMLLKEDPGSYFQYGCILTSIIIDNEFTYRSIIEPYTAKDKVEGFKLINFIFSGFVWAFYISNNLELFSAKSCFLQKDNTLRIFKSRNEMNEIIINHHYKTVTNPFVKEKVYKNNIL